MNPTDLPNNHLLQRLIQNRIRQDIVSMHGYAIQDSRGMVKLDAMENPHALSPELQAELGARLGALPLNRYPNARVDDLRHALAAYARMPEGYDVMLGNGSDELISLLSMAVDLPAAQNPSRRPPRYFGARTRLCDVWHECPVSGPHLCGRSPHG